MVCLSPDVAAATLRDLENDDAGRVAIVAGWPGVGKTSVVGDIWLRGEKSARYFCASRAALSQNLEALNRALRRETGPSTVVKNAGGSLREWSDVLLASREEVGRSTSVLILDEVQRLFDAKREIGPFVEALDRSIDRDDASVFWVLVGSRGRIVSRVEDQLEARLGEKRVGCVCLEPFDYRRSAAALPFERARGLFVGYGLWGGVAANVSGVQGGRSVSRRVVDQLVSTSGRVRHWIGEVVLGASVPRFVGRYAGILRAIGSGRPDQREIAARIGVSRTGFTGVRRMLDRLVEFGLLRATRRYRPKSNSPYHYEITDPALRFYFDLVAPLESRIELEGCYRWDGRAATGTTRTLDLLAPLADGRIMTGAIVAGGAPAGVQVLNDHLTTLRIMAWSGPAAPRHAVFPRGDPAETRSAPASRRIAPSGVGRGVSWAQRAAGEEAPLVFVSRGGFTEGFRSAADRVRHAVHLLTLEDLYR